MNFDGYYEKLEQKMHESCSLEALIVRRKRICIGNFGLPYKAEHGRLVAHRYTVFKEDNTKRRSKNDDTDEL